MCEDLIVFMKSLCTLIFLLTWSSHLYSQVGYGTNNPDPLSIIHLESTDKAFYLPRLTTTQLNAQSGWKDGMVVYNTDSNCVYAREGVVWDCLNLRNFDKIESDDSDVVLTLSADTDNDTESHNPKIVFKQDGEIIESRIGMTGNLNSEFKQGLGNASYFGCFTTHATHKLTHSIQFVTDSTARLTIEGTGNVGIGTNNPTEKLHVDDNIKTDSTIFARDANFSNLPVYADEAAATSGGLATGTLYRTTGGEIRVKL